MNVINQKAIRCMWFILLAVMHCFVFAASQTKHFIYLEQTVNKKDTCKCSIIKNENTNTMTIAYGDDIYQIIADTSFSASSCEIIQKSKNQTIMFKRNNGKMTCKTDNQSEEFEMENFPWYQTPFSLLEFIKSNEKEATFYMATLYDQKKNTDNAKGSIMKLIARKKKMESVTIDANVYQTIKVIITLPGLKSLFWKISYWYRETDGMVVRYEDTRGGPGTPKTIGTLLHEEAK